MEFTVCSQSKFQDGSFIESDMVATHNIDTDLWWTKQSDMNIVDNFWQPRYLTKNEKVIINYDV